MDVRALLTMLGLATVLSGCTTAGRNFDGAQLARLDPGTSTLADATHALAVAPALVYGQSDGGVLALWTYRVTWITDGLYSQKQALLQFGPDGRLVRLVDSNNVLLQPWERRKLSGAPPSGLDGLPDLAGSREAPVPPAQ